MQHAAGAGYRSELRPDDADAVREIVSSTGFFHAAEIEVAVELVQERELKGDASGYHFLFPDEPGSARCYACFGQVAATESSFDLYWIAVHSSARGQGLGRRLLTATESAIAAMGGKRIWVETSSRALYEPTRAFYRACGYVLAAQLEDFYAEGDSKVVFVKNLSQLP